MLVKILIKGRKNSYLIYSGDIIYFGEGLHYPVYGGKQSPVLRDGCEVLRRKNSRILKEDKSLQVTLQTHCLEIEVW